MAEKSEKPLKKPAVKKTTETKAVVKKTPVKKAAAPKKSEPKKAESVKVEIVTNMGTMEMTLYSEKAPNTVKNFLNYVNEGYYDGLTFHRVIKGFMIQGGGFDDCMKQKETKAPVKIESDNGLKNTRGSVAMARTNDPNSATSQFFINLVDNGFLDFREPTVQGYGYAVFGEITKNMEVADSIARVETGKYEYFADVPKEFVIIEKIAVK